MRTSLWELQTATYGRLTESTALMDTITGVHDKVSADAIKPYVTIGEPSVTVESTKTTVIENTVLPLHVWSSYSGKKQTYDIFNLILSALQEPLIVDGSFFMLRRELVSMNVLFDPVEDGVVHGIIEVRHFINN